MTEHDDQLPYRNSFWSRWERRRLAEEDRRRMGENLAAAIFVVVLLTAGFWLVDRLVDYSKAMACLESGHRWCRKL